MKLTTTEVSVLKKKHELTALLKKLDTASEDAVDLLVNTMNSNDKNVSHNLKVDCAKALIGLQIQTSKTISQDDLTRQIADFKMKGASTNLAIDKPQAPYVDMLTIQQIE